jgi:ADP-ribosylglycohydrolase
MSRWSSRLRLRCVVAIGSAVRRVRRPGLPASGVAMARLLGDDRGHMVTVVHERARLDLCYDSLQGLSMGDALGAQFFMVGRSLADLTAGRPPAGVWKWTDDSEMACSVVAALRDRGHIDSDALATEFAERCEPYRGYGAGAVVILHEIRDGRPWREAAGAAFGGQGSCGNGAAMLVAPLGAYHVDSLRRAAEQAVRSAEVTHAHPEGIAGAVVVAVAAAVAAEGRVGAENTVRAGQAACRYSWRMPPRRSRLRMSRRSSRSSSVIGRGSGRRGAAA